MFKENNTEDIRLNKSDPKDFYQAENDCQIITVASNKGGVGKTSIAISLGYYFAFSKNIKTLILELDSSPGDFGPIFDIDEEKNLETALRNPKNFESCVKNIFTNLDVLKGFSDPLSAEKIIKYDFYSLLENLKSSYKTIIVDTQSVINGMVIDVLQVSNSILLISEPSLESIFRISEFINLLDKKFTIKKDKYQLIINKKKLFDYFRLKDISKILSFPIRGFIAFDKGFNKEIFIFNLKNISKTKLFINLSQILKTIKSI